MQQKLQELTDKLYQEGLSKGKEEGEKILKSAKEEAEKILSQAREAADKILDKAAEDAEDIKAKAQSDVKVASEQSLQQTKKDIENLLISCATETGIKDSLSDQSFLKDIIKAVCEKFDAAQAEDMSIVLPEKLKAELEPWVKSELGKSLKHGVSADFTKKVSGGFTIGPKDGSYFVSLTDETFKELIAEYIRPVTRKILFGE